jgi:hypothetical protein
MAFKNGIALVNGMTNTVLPRAALALKVGAGGANVGTAVAFAIWARA